MAPGLEDRTDALALAKTRAWLERAVIGLNLCPFARAVYAKDRVRFAVTAASSADELLEDFSRELEMLAVRDAAIVETTLLVAPHCVEDFLEFNELVQRGGRLIRKKHLDGVIQLASFHPRYCFAGSADDDVGNFTNRSPYPTLHLLREESVYKAVRAFAEPASIYQTNIETLRRLGLSGWAALDVGGTQ